MCAFPLLAINCASRALNEPPKKFLRLAIRGFPCALRIAPGSFYSTDPSNVY